MASSPAPVEYIIGSLSASSRSKQSEEKEHHYDKGGYCPITPGQLLGDKRYKVVRKLGHGQFGIAWLAYDNNRQQHVCLKIVRSARDYSSAALDEIRKLQHVEEASQHSANPGRRHVLSILDSFEHHSKLGSHQVIVTEVLAQSLRSLLSSCPDGLPLPVVKHAAKELLQGLDFLNQGCDLIHTDLKPSNILVSLQDDVREQVIQEQVSRRDGKASLLANRKGRFIPPIKIRTSRPGPVYNSEPIMSPEFRYSLKPSHAESGGYASSSSAASMHSKPSLCPSSSPETGDSATPKTSYTTNAGSYRKDADPCMLSPDDTLEALLKQDRHIPPQFDGLMPSSPSRPHPSVPCAAAQVEWKNVPLHLKLADLGNAQRDKVRTMYEIQTFEYRAPEVLLGFDWGPNVDMWSLGCILFEVATGDALFSPDSDYQTFSKTDDLLAQHQELLGSMDPEYLKFAPPKSFVHKYFDGHFKLRRVQNLDYWPLERVLTEKYFFDLEDAKSFAHFLRRMLTLDPRKRATAAEVLRDPFLEDPVRRLRHQLSSHSKASRSSLKLMASRPAAKRTGSLVQPASTLLNAESSFTPCPADSYSNPWEVSQSAQ